VTDLHDDALGDSKRLQAGRTLPEEAKGRVGDAAGSLEVGQVSVALQLENDQVLQR